MGCAAGGPRSSRRWLRWCATPARGASCRRRAWRRDGDDACVVYTVSRGCQGISLRWRRIRRSPTRQGRISRSLPSNESAFQDRRPWNALERAQSKRVPGGWPGADDLVGRREVSSLHAGDNRSTIPMMRDQLHLTRLQIARGEPVVVVPSKGLVGQPSTSRCSRPSWSSSGGSSVIPSRRNPHGCTSRLRSGRRRRFVTPPTQRRPRFAHASQCGGASGADDGR